MLLARLLVHAALVFCMLGLGSSAYDSLPPQFPPYYVQKNYSQRVDHFNSEDSRRFNQRFLLNDTFFDLAKSPKSPIIFYTGSYHHRRLHCVGYISIAC